MTDKVAIIGYACRLPGQVSTPEDLWELCTRGRNGWSEMPKDRFSFDAFHHPNPSKPGTFNPKGGYFLSDDISRFDASFFNLTAKEAISLDPQQRLLLECTFEAFESAGVPREQFAGRNVGVYVGGSFSDYELMNLRDLETTPMHQATGCAQAMQSNRISYAFDLRGPSMTFDTACSSSLVALHHAVRSLQSGESTEAIVGGSHLNILPDYFVSMSTSQLFNDHGKTFAFDERAESGFARGEGAGVVLLKPLAAAIRDRDPIRAVICNTGTNQDGRTQGITNPNGQAQRDIIRKVYQDAGLDPRLCGYVEMHGTGTKVGDPIEASAVHEALSIHRSPEDPLYIGSVKSNVGHLEGASGVVSLIKAAMMLDKGLALPTTNFRKANPAIPMDEWNMKVLTTTKPWPRNKKYVSISNYGFGGANAHCVLERPPVGRDASLEVDPDQLPDPLTKLFLVSANDKESLQGRIKNLGIYFERRPEAFEKMLYSNMAFTLGSRTSNLAYRLAIPASSLSMLTQKFAQMTLNCPKVLREPTQAFVFTGQGAQWAQMGMGLMDQYPIFASAINKASEYLTEIGADFSLLEELQKPAKISRVNSPHISQPACTAIQIGLVNLYAAWGIRPASVIGHSSGEIGAAYAAGAYDADAAMALAYHRGMMTLKLKELYPTLRGGMIAVGYGPEAIKPYMERIQPGYLTIACVNSPTSVTISGDESAMAELHDLLDEDDIFNRQLKIDVAYHSEHMARVSDLYLASIADRTPATSLTAKFYSSVYGREVDASELGPEYWIKNLVSTVLFSDALAPMCSSESRPDHLIELGPHSTLKGPIKDILKTLGSSATKIGYSSSLLRNVNAVESVMEVAGAVYAKGTTLDMIAINFPATGAKHNYLVQDLPRYPWQHSASYWHEARIPQKHLTRSGKRNDVLGVLANYSNDLEPTWRNIIRLDDVPWLRHHKMQGIPVFPIAGYLSMAVEAAQQRADDRNTTFDSFELREVVVGAALVLNDGSDTETTITLRPFSDASRGQSDSWDEFKICSWESKRGWAEHCRGLVRVQDSGKDRGRSVAADPMMQEDFIKRQSSSVEAQATRRVDETDMYAKLSAVGAGYGTTFQGLKECYIGTEHCRGDIVVQDTRSLMPKEFESDLVIHPSLLDIFLHLTWPILGAAGDQFDTLYMPTLVRSVKIDRDIIKVPGEHLSVWCVGSPDLGNPKPTTFEICATRPGNLGKPVIKFDGFVMTPIRGAGASGDADTEKVCFKLTTQPFEAGPIPVEKMESNGHRANGHQANGSNGLVETEDGQAETGSGVRTPVEKPDISIILFGESPSVASDLAEAIDVATGSRPPIFKLGETDCKDKRIVLLETGDKSLRTATASEFESLKEILLHAAKTVWVYSRDTPESAMSVGMARSIRSENMSHIATLGVESTELNSSWPSKSIMRTLDALWLTEHVEPINDMEFVATDGKLYVQRIEEDRSMNDFISNETDGSVLEKQPYKQEDRRLQLQIGSYGSLNTIHWVDDVPEKLKDFEIEIEVKATGVNFKDVVVCMGQVSQPYIGVECSGIVSAVGSKVSHLRVGQRVMAMTEGAYSTYARCLGTSGVPIHDTMTFEQAATIPVVFCTAYYGLFDLGRMTRGEKVLIHAAAGGVGQAAIMLAQMVGAEIFATVGSQDKKQFLIDTYSIPEDRIFYSRDTSFGADIRRATDGAGVDIVLNSLAGDILRETWDTLAPFGRFIEIGKADITRNSRLDMLKFEYNCTFASVDLTKVAAYKPQLMQRLLADVTYLMSKGILSPISPIKSYPISETELAFRALQSGKAMGKLVVVPHADDQILASKAKVRDILFRPDATYIIVGGTGGLGRSLTKWMSMKGARNIVLTSRSAAVNPRIQALTDQLAPSGTNILVCACDVSNEESLEKLVNEDLKDLPPIRGVVHGAMVLRDMLFEQMTQEDFHAVTTCKVEGALNLHKVLSSSPLDFFVALSSVAGVVGNRGQAAYSAANVFLDQFMAFRRKQDLPGTSIDLAAVSNIGYLADGSDARREEVLKNIGGQTIDESKVLALFAAAVTGKMNESCQGQCITGLDTSDDSSFWLSDEKFAVLREAVQAASGTGGSSSTATVALSKVLRTAASKEDAKQALYVALAEKIAAILVLPADAIEPSQTLKNLGLDSLVAIELRNWITRETEINVQVLELLSSGSIMNLVELVLKKMGLLE
ncbi:polyketide synthase [Dothidotthia symphoricarpi CBS 119687]|uniref:Polyketide synthase n=1 Tax=Dothidotthia symphoricarpi CBS 119687 TaxID=1392245 RepID=A0A6A6A144_9PLEO|nr:polyketide synthase [Dothidotthia symphoricarpi CBS 119687]KAF2125236.1 polyketide synthase [Dothidotthia symphoricarpi CBS 119687]